MKRTHFVLAIVFLVLIIDQALKIWIKTTFEYGEEVKILGLEWARLHFVENEGMAFGFTFGGSYGKLALSLFRIVVVTFLGIYLFQLIRSKLSYSFLACVSLILAGALGNIIDSTFYGIIFSETPYHGGISQFMPEGGGYAPVFYGKVVDMFYFPIMQGTFPDWMPIWGGEQFSFFRPVFNVADAAITTGILSVILFHRDFFSQGHTEAVPDANTTLNTSRPTPDAEQVVDDAEGGKEV